MITGLGGGLPSMPWGRMHLAGYLELLCASTLSGRCPPARVCPGVPRCARLSTQHFAHIVSSILTTIREGRHYDSRFMCQQAETQRG